MSYELYLWFMRTYCMMVKAHFEFADTVAPVEPHNLFFKAQSDSLHSKYHCGENGG